MFNAEQDGSVMLSLAATRCSLDILQALVAAGCDVQAVGGVSGLDSHSRIFVDVAIHFSGKPCS